VSFKVTEFGTNPKLIYDFLLVINTNLPLYLAPLLRYGFLQLQNRYIWLPFLRLNPPTEGFPWDDLRKISVDVNGQLRYKMA